MPDTFIDNDVVLKSCIYELLDRIAESLNRSPENIGILASAIFVLRPTLNKRGIELSSMDFFQSVAVIEPTEGEIVLAAAIEEEALKQGCEVDAGESLLAAVVASRGERLVTGDKRAIRGFARLSANSDPCSTLRGRIVTMEATIAGILATIELAFLRKSVCANPKTDLAISACFMCHQANCTVDDVLTALSSYQKALSSETDGFVNPDLST